jgi:UPF0755 protein
MWRHIVSNFLTVLIVILVGLGGLAAWAKKQYTNPGPLTQAVCLRVEPGASFARVSEDLRGQGAISSAYIFRAGADYAGKSGALKFGSYLIDPGASMEGIVDQITSGGPSSCGTELNFRIGVTAQDMILRELDPVSGQYVEKAKFDPAAEPAPEGFAEESSKADVRTRVTLAEGVTSWQVVEALKSADFLKGEIKQIPAEEALVMASIVEKETGVPSERRQVASVFINRLEQGIKLQTDPTVIYGVTKGQGVLGRGLRQSELRRETPYNTYVIDGLPPTPIANPGRAAIEAALNPDSTRYLFFVADGSGGHAFAETLDEHNRNVAAWRKIEAEQQNQGAGN